MEDDGNNYLLETLERLSKSGLNRKGNRPGIEIFCRGRKLEFVINRMLSTIHAANVRWSDAIPDKLILRFKVLILQTISL